MTPNSDSRTLLALAARFCLPGLLAAHGVAQCANEWVPGDALFGADDRVVATTMWDPDGAGPALPLLVAGGNFRVIGTQLANCIVAYEPVSRTWSTLGSGIVPTHSIAGLGPSTVRALAVLPDGGLLAAGDIDVAGGVAVANVARWDGSTWSPFGAGLTGAVNALAVLPNGEVVAGGAFSIAGVAGVPNIARWDGTAWVPLGNGVSGAVNALAVLPGGEVVAGGAFATASGIVANAIARWNGTAWSALAAGVSGDVLTLLTLPGGDLLAGGTFTGASGVAATIGIARWDGAGWSTVAGGIPSPVRGLTLHPNGDVIAVGSFGVAGGVPAGNVARFDGTAWSPVGDGLPHIADDAFTVCVLPDGGLFLGGKFTRAGSFDVENIARWDGVVWSAPSPGSNQFMYAVAALPGGDFVVGGSFTTIGGVAANYVARRDGANWLPIGNGPSMNLGSVNSLAVRSEQDIAVVIPSVSGQAARRVQRWNGASWSQVGPQFTNRVQAIVYMANGDLVAAGDFSDRIVRWDGVAWQPMNLVPPSPTLPGLSSAKVLPNGDLIVSGSNLVVGGVACSFARWDGTTWTAMPASPPIAASRVIEVLSNGDLVASPHNGPLMRWNGTQWSTYAPWTAGFVSGIVPLPGEQVVVAGAFTAAAGTPARRVARWDGQTWSAFGSGLSSDALAAVRAGNGDVVVVGSFRMADDRVSVSLARLTTTCPATASPFGSGCTGSGGPNALTATSLPWLGSTFSAAATGMPANALALALTGFTTASVPLSAILPQGGAGCFLLTTPDIADVALPAAGAVATQLAIPAAPSLVGMVFHQQVVPLELDAFLNLTAVTSTNRLTAVIGSY